MYVRKYFATDPVYIATDLSNSLTGIKYNLIFVIRKIIINMNSNTSAVLDVVTENKEISCILKENKEYDKSYTSTYENSLVSIQLGSIYYLHLYDSRCNLLV